jgi:hypothetical protein
VCSEIENTIFITDEDWDKWCCPDEKIKPDEKWVKHIEYLGKNIFRFHVKYYCLTYKGEVIVKCSEPNCIINKQYEG